MWQAFFKPEYQNWRWAFCMSLGIYLYLFISFLEPFKGDKITYIWASTEAYISHSIINFSLVILITAFFVVFLPSYFPKFFLPKNFTLQRFGFLNLFTALFIEMGYFFSNYYFFHFDMTLSWFMIFMFRTTLSSFLFAGIPFSLGYLILFNYINNEGNQKESIINYLPPNIESNHEEKDIQIVEAAPPQYNGILIPTMLNFSDNSNKKNLEIALDSLYYITSAQNYIEVFYQNKNAVLSRQVLRNSLKAIEEEMIVNNDDSPLIRCHKAFIINREKVIELRGPAKSAQVILDGIDTLIPVSRQKYTELETQFPPPNKGF
jgi:LytTr DNA-binding domain